MNREKGTSFSNSSVLRNVTEVKSYRLAGAIDDLDISNNQNAAYG